MKISKMISDLQDLLKEHGDIDLYIERHNEYTEFFEKDVYFDIRSDHPKHPKLRMDVEPPCQCGSCFEEKIIDDEKWIEIW